MIAWLFCERISWGIIHVGATGYQLVGHLRRIAGIDLVRFTRATYLVWCWARVGVPIVLILRGSGDGARPPS
jgi:hypothetical protein